MSIVFTIIVFTIIGTFILLRHIQALVRSVSDPARNSASSHPQQERDIGRKCSRKRHFASTCPFAATIPGEEEKLAG